MAFAAADGAFALSCALPLAILLQRSLRHAQLVSAPRIDAKTGLLNAATWQREAAIEIARAARKHAPVAVAILDTGHFTKASDTFGHLAGDAVLAAIAAATRALLRDYDITGRFGGEEFAILLPHTSAAEVAGRLRAAIPRIAIPGGGPISQVPSGITVSIGVAASAGLPATCWTSSLPPTTPCTRPRTRAGTASTSSATARTAARSRAWPPGRSR